MRVGWVVWLSQRNRSSSPLVSRGMRLTRAPPWHSGGCGDDLFSSRSEPALQTIGTEDPHGSGRSSALSAPEEATSSEQTAEQSQPIAALPWAHTRVWSCPLGVLGLHADRSREALPSNYWSSPPPLVGWLLRNGVEGAVDYLEGAYLLVVDRHCSSAVRVVRSGLIWFLSLERC
jgi:hypothetical protein